MKDVNYSLAKKYGRSVAVDIYKMFSNVSMRGPRFTWIRFPNMVARLAEHNLFTIFAKQPTNMKELENICHNECVTKAKKLTKKEIGENTVIYVLISKSEIGIKVPEQDFFDYKFEKRWTEMWIDPESMSVKEYQSLLKVLKKERANVVFYNDFPELLFLISKQRTVKTWIYKRDEMFPNHVGERLIFLK